MLHHGIVSTIAFCASVFVSAMRYPQIYPLQSVACTGGRWTNTDEKKPRSL